MKRPSFLALLALPFALTASAGEVGATGSTEHFTATLNASACSVGRSCVVTITAQAKEGQRIHKPMVIAKQAGPDDLKTALGRASETLATGTLTFTPAKTGTTKVGAGVSLCVAAASNCVMEKVDLELDVDVK